MQTTQERVTGSGRLPVPPGTPPPVPPAMPPPVLTASPATSFAAPPAGKPRSPLGRLTMSVVVLALGVLVLVDLAGAPIAASVYFGVLLTVTGAGLLIGGWYGRARGLIALGAVLSVGLAIASAAEGLEIGTADGSVTWKPASIEQLERSYEINMGNAVLDLSAVDFTGRSESVDVRVDVGDLDIILPPTVDVQIQASVDVGNAVVLDQRWSGIGQSQRRIADDGTDGPGGGTLTISATVDVGDLEVRR